MGNSHGRHRSDPLAAKLVGLGHKLQPPAGQPRAHQNIQKEAKANPKKKDNAQQQQKTDSASTKKGRKKKSKRTSDQPRKGRKESFSKYIPGYVPTTPIDEELGGLYDAVDYDDPYTIAREKLQNPPKPATQLHQVRNAPCQPRGVPAQPSTHCTCGYSANPNTSQYYGANADDYLYLDSIYNDNHECGEYPYNAEDNTEGTSHNDSNCDTSSAHRHDTETGYGAPPDQIGHHAGGNTDGNSHNDHNYDGGTADTGGVHDVAGSYDFGGDSGGGYDCGGSGDAGGS